MKKYTSMAGVLAALTVLAAGQAFAHAGITRSSIADGSTVNQSPASITVVFNEAIALSAVTLTDDQGRPVPLRYRQALNPITQVTVPLPQLGPGRYTLNLRSMGRDSHAMTLTTRFSVSSGSGAQPPARPDQAPVATGMNHGSGGMSGMNMSGMSHGSGMSVMTSILDGQVFTAAPRSVAFTFEHPMRLTTVRLTTATGETVPVQVPSQSQGTSRVEVALPTLEPDSYILVWAADAGDHRMNGTIRFRVR